MCWWNMCIYRPENYTVLKHLSEMLQTSAFNVQTEIVKITAYLAAGSMPFLGPFSYVFQGVQRSTYHSLPSTLGG